MYKAGGGSFIQGIADVECTFSTKFQKIVKHVYTQNANFDAGKCPNKNAQYWIKVQTSVPSTGLPRRTAPPPPTVRTDDALVRPGRFDRIVRVELPNSQPPPFLRENNVGLQFSRDLFV